MRTAHRPPDNSLGHPRQTLWRRRRRVSVRPAVRSGFPTRP
ncbi:hypothetical protein ACFPM0_25635 [Pseudonocardia sulfidoxydans]